MGTPTAASTEVYARTVTQGDPAWTGSLAGVALGLSVYHIMEPEIQSQVDPQLYEEQIRIMAAVLDVDDLIEAVRRVRSEAGG